MTFHAQKEGWNVPIRSSIMLPGYISLSGGKIAGIHVWKRRETLDASEDEDPSIIFREKTTNS